MSFLDSVWEVNPLRECLRGLDHGLESTLRGGRPTVTTAEVEQRSSARCG